jgi:hypothetical protein
MPCDRKDAEEALADSWRVAWLRARVFAKFTGLLEPVVAMPRIY